MVANQAVVPDAGWAIEMMRFSSPTKLVLFARHDLGGGKPAEYAIFDHDLCSGLRSKVADVYGVPIFALDASGAPILFVPAMPYYGAARLVNGTAVPVASSCVFSEIFGLDVVGDTAVVTTGAEGSREITEFTLATSDCDRVRLNDFGGDETMPLSAGMGKAPARLSPDGTQVLMAGWSTPSTSGPGCDPTGNDFVLYDRSTKSRRLVAYSPPVASPECTDSDVFAWYPDNRRVLIAGPSFFVLDTATGTTTTLGPAPSPTLTNGWVEVSPDGKLAATVKQFGGSVDVTRL